MWEERCIGNTVDTEIGIDCEMWVWAERPLNRVCKGLT